MSSSITKLHLAAAFAAAMFAVFLLWLRAPDAFYAPQFWAEDGTLFWLGQYTEGWHAFFTPYAGYLQTAPRLTAFLASFFDVARAPRLYATAAILLTAWASVTAALSVRPPLMSFLFGCALLIPPHSSGEILGNISNTQWFFAPVLGLVLVSETENQPVVAANNTAFAFLASLSGPFSIIAAPLAVLRFWWRRDLLSVLVILGGLVQFVTLLRAYPAPPPSSHGTLGHLLQTMVLRSFPPDSTAVLAGGALLAIALFTRNDRNIRLGVMWVSIAILAATSIKFANDPQAFDGWNNGPRYFYPFHVTIWWCAISLLFIREVRLIGAAWLAFSIMTYPRDQFRRAPLKNVQWYVYTRDLGKHELHVPINPEGWMIDIPPRSTPN
jgi:hypothetical protein